MATEIERKFLVLNDDWRKLATRQKMVKQGYFAGGGKASIRIRVVDESANINIKSATLEVTRKEYEFPVPYADAREMLEQLCEKPLIEKIRYYVPYGNHIWEVDEFTGDNAGLVVAEIELSQLNESFDKPPWLGEEVSHDTRYYNVCLVRHPYKDWKPGVGR